MIHSFIVQSFISFSRVICSTIIVFVKRIQLCYVGDSVDAVGEFRFARDDQDK